MNRRLPGCRKRQRSEAVQLLSDKTSNNALAAGDNPDTPIRPVPSRRWEATRANAGKFPRPRRVRERREESCSSILASAALLLFEDAKKPAEAGSCFDCDVAAGYFSLGPCRNDVRDSSPSPGVHVIDSRTPGWSWRKALNCECLAR